MKILLFKGRGILSAIIRWQQRTMYSHAAVLLWGLEIIEAWQGKGVQRKFLKSLENILCLECPGMTQQQEFDVYSFMQSQVGRGYDYLGVLRFVSRQRNTTNEEWFCSELVYAAFLAAGINLLARSEPWEVSPGLLARSPLLVESPL